MNPATSSRYASGRRAPFYHVARLGLYQTMEVLLQSKDHDPIQAHDFAYALEAATRAGESRLVELLLQRQQRFYNSQDESFLSALNEALWQASSWGHEQIVKMLIHQGASVNERGGICDNTALQAAAAEGHESVVRLLLDAGADINARCGGYGSTALLAATSENHHRVVQTLLARGADTTFKHATYGTALQAACVLNHAEIVGMLLEADMGNDDVDELYAEYLYTAVTNGHDNIVQMLLSSGARLTAQFLLAAMPRDLTTVGPLILPYVAKDAVIEKHTVSGKTLLHWAVETGSAAFTNRCLELGADVDAIDVHGDTALHYGAGLGRYEIVEILIRANADRTILNSHGVTALDCAHDISGNPYQDIVAYLQQ
jgi:ankyrin repeat protein